MEIWYNIWINDVLWAGVEFCAWVEDIEKITQKKKTADHSWVMNKKIYQFHAFLIRWHLSWHAFNQSKEILLFKK